VAEIANSLIITRLSVLLIGTSVIATATWIRPNWMRLMNIHSLALKALADAQAGSGQIVVPGNFLPGILRKFIRIWG
jgi:hypothetical protein